MKIKSLDRQKLLYVRIRGQNEAGQLDGVQLKKKNIV